MQNRKKHRLDKALYSQPGAYFITVCVKDRKPILSAIVGADDHIGPQTDQPHVGADDHIGPQVSLTEIGKVVDKYTKQIPGIGAYVIMPNHVHMMIHISGKNIGEGPMWSSAPTEGYSATVQTEEIAGYRNRTSAPTEGFSVMDGPMWSSAPTEGNVQNMVRTWKTLIAKELGQSVWQRSYYDHIVRDEQDYVKILEYIMGNPGKWAEDKYFT